MLYNYIDSIKSTMFFPWREKMVKLFGFLQRGKTAERERKTRAPRYSIPQIIVSFKEYNIEGPVENISLTGLKGRIRETKTEFKNPIMITVWFKGRVLMAELRARIVRNQTVTIGGKIYFELGINFTNPSEFQLGNLKALLSKIDAVGVDRV